MNARFSTFWSLFGHDDQCCLYVEHNDGYSFYYPGRTTDMHARALIMVRTLMPQSSQSDQCLVLGPARLHHERRYTYVVPSLCLVYRVLIVCVT